MNDIRIIDTHCHLDFNELKTRLDEVIKDAKINNVTDMVTISTNLSRIDTIKDISEQYQEVFFTVGVHPNEAHQHIHCHPRYKRFSIAEDWPASASR